MINNFGWYFFVLVFIYVCDCDPHIDRRVPAGQRAWKRNIWIRGANTIIYQCSQWLARHRGSLSCCHWIFVAFELRTYELCVYLFGHSLIPIDRWSKWIRVVLQLDFSREINSPFLKTRLAGYTNILRFIKFIVHTGPTFRYQIIVYKIKHVKCKGFVRSTLINA